MSGYLRIAAQLLVVMPLLVACNRIGPPAVPRTVSVAAPIDALIDTASSEEYRYEIRYVALPPQDAPLAAAMRAYGDKQKREFLEGLGDNAARSAGANGPW